MAPRVGRPRGKLPKARAIVTRRVRSLIDHVHDGNLKEASRATGLPYPTIRDLYVGRTTNPSLQTLERLRAPYHIHLQWFTEEGWKEVPSGGFVGYLPHHPLMARAGLMPREVSIPYTAWPMYEVFATLSDWLDQQPPSPERLIVGDATERQFTERLTSFLLQPLLALEKTLEDIDLIVPLMPLVPQNIPSDEDDERWIRTMKALGLFWKAAIPRILETAERDLQRQSKNGGGGRT